MFHMLLENKTNEQIANELKISIRTVQNYKRRLEQRYGTIWRQKTNDTLFLECTLFKNRMLRLYKALEDQVTSDETSGTDKAKCAEVAANIAIDILKMESEGIKAVKQLVSKNVQGKNILDNRNNNRQSKNRYDYDESNNIQPENDDPNRKF
ncbi:MAG TPA: LuxR C-terminal-related transcriptional regulator [Nitrososphaeraceae archaeon]|nr:LuxR C-terminal-related transcriptional regulator [Nitrososphaeraceae archaeon]